MINYVEKGFGLHVYLNSLGLGIQDANGVWFNREGRDNEVNDAIAAYPLSSAQNAICVDIDAHATTLRDRVVVGVSSAEMSSWAVKRQEAINFKASGFIGDAPMLNTEAAARGIPLSAIVDRVLAGASDLSALEANIAGVAGKHKDAVRATTTFSGALSYDWSGGWPSV